MSSNPTSVHKVEANRDVVQQLLRSFALPLSVALPSATHASIDNRLGGGYCSFSMIS